MPAVAALCAVVLLFALSYTPPLPGGRLEILFTHEVRGHVVACGCYEGQPGGLGRLPAAARDELASPSTLLLDAGGFVFDPPMEGFRDPERPGAIVPAKMDYLRKRHRAVAAVMNRLGYDAVAPGDSDFLLGVQHFLLEVAYDRDEGLPLVCANLMLNAPQGKKPLFPAHRVVTVGRGSVFWVLPLGGVQVGITGLLSPSAHISRLPEDVYALSVENPEQAARDQVAVLREKGATVVVLLYHGPWAEAQAVARAVEGIDVVVVGKTGGQGAANPPTPAGTALLVQIAPGASHVGKVTVAVEGGRAGAREFGVIELGAACPEDARILEPWARFQASLEAAPVVPPLPQEVPEAYAGSGVCADCHPAAVDQWKTTNHAKAFDALKARGHVADPECLQCHTTGFGRASGYGAPGAAAGLEGVGCGVCHGPRAAHVESWRARKDAGEALPEAKHIPNAFSFHCLRCHTAARDPMFETNSKERWEKVVH